VRRAIEPGKFQLSLAENCGAGQLGVGATCRLWIASVREAAPVEATSALWRVKFPMSRCGWLRYGSCHNTSGN
jgi:hypothetical protein